MLGMANAVVTIIDFNAVGTIKTITVEGYGASSRTGDSGGIDDTTSLETPNLSNSGLNYTGSKVRGAADIAVDDTAAIMALNFDRVGFSGYYDGDAVPNTINVNPTGNNYVNLIAATETLNVSSTALLRPWQV